MKHQINRLLASHTTISKEDMEEIDNAIQIYDSSYNTGNKLLDTLLTQSKLKCDHNHITFSAMVDGKALSFLSGEDLYSLFGNAIDNAFEASMKLPEEKRTIALTTKQANGFLMLQIWNYYQGEVKLEPNGLPKTIKDDTNYHGFGTKSMLAVVKKYKGSLTIHSENGEYHVNILFPLS